MSGKRYIETRNGSAPVALSGMPLLVYDEFRAEVLELLADEQNHCLTYFAHRGEGGRLQFYCLIAGDETGSIWILSHAEQGVQEPLKSLTASCHAMHIFERELHESHGVRFADHPWLKPVRYPHYRADQGSTMDNYPFYEITGEQLHEVGVGPIHAGVIEPGHFRFICNGEKVLHLEIQLGYQHRGIERLFLEASGGLQRSLLAENIAGDTAVGHGLAHAQLAEALAGSVPSRSLQIERCIALEMERIAVHIGDTAALCTDVAYQLGQVACEALRTMVINTTQYWCGNRFGKSLVRPGGTNHPLTEEILNELLTVVGEVDRRYANVAECIYTLTSVLGRFEETGQVTRRQAAGIGAVGMAARSSGLLRDIRVSHPFQYYGPLEVMPMTISSGDVMARGMLRVREVGESVKLIRRLAEAWREAQEWAKGEGDSSGADSGRGKGPDGSPERPRYNLQFMPDVLAVSLTEGWRGEICHVALTDSRGKLVRYVIKDPSMHNWMALALAVRDQEISDFPVCNKSFNLSYCGNDL